MQESGLILSEYEEINSLLLKPIVATQRIKYTCINVSLNHIALGSTSGSIYLFTREPCVFQQLIPLAEGSITHILISPDEKTLALSSKRGSVCVVNIKPSVKLLSVSNEHLGKTITSLCWNSKSSEIYVGDNNGKISTIVLSIFTVNGMFQAPSCALMHLDSSIVQMDYYLHYLLVSTLTRCYICDTAQEQFKQIGNKARDGEFGGCILKNCNEYDKKSSNIEDDKLPNKNVSLNSLIGLTDDSAAQETNFRIYCARPGCRLWEVNSQGIVVKTHQFKDALSIAPSGIFKSSTIKSMNDDKDDNNKNDKNDSNPSSGQQTLNFSRLLVISKKYLLSYTSNSLYIIDPVNTNVILWTDELANIFMIDVIEDRIYLMTILGTFHCLLLSSIESLILKLYDCKLFNDCLQASVQFKEQLAKIITNNEVILSIDKLSKSNQNNSQNNDIINLLQPIVSSIQSHVNTPQRLTSGIVVVNSGTGKLRNDIQSLNIQSINTTNNSGNDDKHREQFSDSEIVCETMKKKRVVMTNNQRHNSVDNQTRKITHSLSQIDLSDYKKDSDKDIKSDEKQIESQAKQLKEATLAIQSDLVPVHELICSLESPMSAEELEELMKKIGVMINDINHKYDDIKQFKHFNYEIIRSCERHYYSALLGNVSIDLLSSLSSNADDFIVNELIKAFVDINCSQDNECTCGYPRPSTEQCKEAKYLKVGRALLEKMFKGADRNKCIILCNNVPYMWREYLTTAINERHLLDHDIIPLCLQTNDNIVLELLFRLIDDRDWKIVVECVRKISNGHCLFCNHRFDVLNVNTSNHQIDWSGVALETMKSQSIDAAMKFLQRLEEKMPHVKLKQEFCQSLVFSKLLERYGFEHIVDFGEHKIDSDYGSLCSTEAQKVILNALEKDLERPIKNTIFGSGNHHWGIIYKSKSSTCSSCTLSLQTPVLLGNNGISIFPCGHAYHVNCLIQKKMTKCFLHQQ